jgi:hypothetical protein
VPPLTGVPPVSGALLPVLEQPAAATASAAPTASIVR